MTTERRRNEKPLDEDIGLFGDHDDFHAEYAEWKGMPEFEVLHLSPLRSVIIHFASQEDIEDFERRIEQDLPPETGKVTRSMWHPRVTIGSYKDKRYRDANEAADEA